MCFQLKQSVKLDRPSKHFFGEADEKVVKRQRSDQVVIARHDQQANKFEKVRKSKVRE